MQRNVYIENMPLEKALTLFMNSLQEQGYFAIESEEVDVITSQGRITSKAVSARRSSPHYIASAMDGIAVRASCTAQANEQNPIYLKPAEDFIEVDTGDYVPLPFDAVIMIEDVNFIDGQAQIIKPAVPWQHIRSVGEDLVAHDLLLTSFTPIGPFEIGSMITGGLERVEVVKQPRVAIILPERNFGKRPAMIWPRVKSLNPTAVCWLPCVLNGALYLYVMLW
ncbi:hypothetical protein [Syntrophomonas palmitatica]|uniref:hypothetical protein n=1 Tax=Syntrophomonas palmitatica TaxID=402877 RepID=UPI000A516DB5|nr:hypothetical protein [Syntrophomonas palmitatica]